MPFIWLVLPEKIISNDKMECELKVGEKAASQNGKQCDHAILIRTSVSGRGATKKIKF